jgi:hypothetical protein
VLYCEIANADGMSCVWHFRKIPACRIPVSGLRLNQN